MNTVKYPSYKHFGREMKDGEMEGGLTMSKKMEEKGSNTNGDSDQDHKNARFVCPVCRKPLHKKNLVDARSIVEDNLYFVGGVRIVDSRVELYCDFQHQFDEEGITMDNPHKLTAIVDVHFDQSGDYIQFEILKISAG
ncbi:MAG: hypothetical protein AYK18_15205 [Theionarchaea archaeon DG-70]|nr:MAG: hypothetical protein AYK18_15205 [Theionarchaea archaeon DG-70]